jgi:phage terminase large subunit-like protein
MHLTGNYPEWWEGYRFSEPVQAWVVGPSREITRESLQKQYYLGDPTRKVRGLIEPSLITKKTALSGIPEAISTVSLRHSSGGTSNLTFKSYDQALDKFSGTFVNVIHLDEEPGDYRILEECAMRIMSTRSDQYGMMMISMTPHKSHQETLDRFQVDDGKSGVISKNKRFYIQAGWEDALHLKEEEKEDYISGSSETQIEIRTKGTPRTGSGQVFRETESLYTQEAPRYDAMSTSSSTFIPPSFKILYGVSMAESSAGTWGMVLVIQDQEGVITVLGDYKGTDKLFDEHAQSIKSKLPHGYKSAIQGFVSVPDHAEERYRLLEQLNQNHHLRLQGISPLESREYVIDLIRKKMKDGTFKIISFEKEGKRYGCVNLMNEIRKYSRDLKGRIISRNDQCIEALFEVMNILLHHRDIVQTGSELCDEMPQWDYRRFMHLRERPPLYLPSYEG